MPISTSTIIVAIIATLCLIGSLIGKIRWLTLIAIFLYLIAGWMITGEYFTGIKFQVFFQQLMMTVTSVVVLEQHGWSEWIGL